MARRSVCALTRVGGASPHKPQLTKPRRKCYCFYSCWRLFFGRYRLFLQSKCQPGACLAALPRPQPDGIVLIYAICHLPSAIRHTRARARSVWPDVRLLHDVFPDHLFALYERCELGRRLAAYGGVVGCETFCGSW